MAEKLLDTRRMTSDEQRRIASIGLKVLRPMLQFQVSLMAATPRGLRSRRPRGPDNIAHLGHVRGGGLAREVPETIRRQRARISESECVPAREQSMKFLALAVVIAVLVAASAAFVSNQSDAVLACVSSCHSINTGAP